MTNKQERGRRITVGIALLAAAPPAMILIFLVVSGHQVTLGRWILDGATNVLFAWLLIKGRSWVRLLTVIGFALGGTSSIIRVMFVGGSIVARVIVVLLGGIQIAAALVLLRHPAVRAYFTAENAPAALNLGGA